MLVLSRNSGEQIHIADNIVVTVLAIHGKTVRLGIDAPREILIMRLELLKVMPATTADVSIPIVDSIQRPADER